MFDNNPDVSERQAILSCDDADTTDALHYALDAAKVHQMAESDELGVEARGSERVLVDGVEVFVKEAGPDLWLCRTPIYVEPTKGGGVGFGNDRSDEHDPPAYDTDPFRLHETSLKAYSIDFVSGLRTQVGTLVEFGHVSGERKMMIHVAIPYPRFHAALTLYRRLRYS